VADEKLVVGAARTGLRLFRKACAIQVSAAKVAVGPNDDAVARRRKAEAAYVDEIGKLKFAPTFIGPTGSTAVAEITARINTEVLFKRLTPEKAAEQWISESKAAIGK